MGIQKPDVDIGSAYLEADVINVYSTVSGVVNLGFVNQGVLMVRARQVYVYDAVGIGDGTVDFGHMHIDIGDIYLAADNTTGIARMGAGVSLVGKVDHIIEYPPGYAATTAINVVSGSVSLQVDVINVDIAYTVVAAAELNLFVCDLIGAETAADGSIVSVIKADQLRENMTFQRIFDWLLFNGGVASSLNGGRITTTRLPVQSTDPGIQFKVDTKDYQPAKSMIIGVVAAHSIPGEVLDFDLNYVSVGIGENFNTEAPSVVVNATPVAPAIAYDAFIFYFLIPAADVESSGYMEFQMSRDTAGGVGDTHIWEIRAYQSP